MLDLDVTNNLRPGVTNSSILSLNRLYLICCGDGRGKRSCLCGRGGRKGGGGSREIGRVLVRGETLEAHATMKTVSTHRKMCVIAVRCLGVCCQLHGATNRL